MDFISTNEAKCRDCYRCLRECPVKAIRITAGSDQGTLYARVIDELCVQDARCVLTCPQNAKKVVSSLAEVRQSLRQGVRMAAGIAPSFVAGFPMCEPEQVPALLRKLGFAVVQETSIGAELVAAGHRSLGFSATQFSSACPVVVNLIEIYYPELIPVLSPLVSPMIAHGRYLKRKYPGCKTVFIGPCAAKKAEARIKGIDDAVDFVLGFDELLEWARDEGMDPAKLAPGEFDGPAPGPARLFPVEGGILKAVGINGDGKDQVESFTVTGLENCIEFLEHFSRCQGGTPVFVELLACRGGCINGPLMAGDNADIFTRRRRVIEYFKTRTRQETGSLPVDDFPAGLLHREYVNRQKVLPLPGEDEIREILARTGKRGPEDELNCGACGYDTCRDKAVAVYQGNAELEMCIPYMRKRAESMSNQVIAAMPNGVIIVDENLEVKEVNPAAEKMLQVSAREMVGTQLSNFINTENFSKVLQTGQMLSRVGYYPELDIIAREIIFPLESERAVVGILVDITAEERQKEQFELVKDQTIARAQEVITKQMRVAQEIAGLLGETTAETKILLSKLIELMQNKPTEK